MNEKQYSSALISYIFPLKILVLKKKRHYSSALINYIFPLENPYMSGFLF